MLSDDDLRSFQNIHVDHAEIRQEDGRDYLRLVLASGERLAIKARGGELHVSDESSRTIP
jgi:hypothetical protein